MGEVRILTRVHAAGLEPYLSLLLVHLVDRANEPIAPGNLVFDLACRAVIQIEMTPSVALRRPNNLLAVGEIAPVSGSGLSEIAAKWAIGEERLRFFTDDCARFPGNRVDFDDPINLMPALIVFKGKSSAVLPPHEIGKAIGIRKQAIVDDCLFLRINIKQHRLSNVQRVAGLRIVAGGVFWLKLVRW